MRLFQAVLMLSGLALGFTFGPAEQASAQWRRTCTSQCYRICLHTSSLPSPSRPAYCSRRCIAQCYPWSTQTPQAPILVNPVPRPVPVFRSAPPPRFTPVPANAPTVYRPPAYRQPVYRPPVHRPPAARPSVYRPSVYRPPVYRPTTAQSRQRVTYPRQQVRRYPQTVR